MIEILQATDWPRLKKLRIAALKDAPDAFASTLEYALALSDSEWEEGLQVLPTFVIKSKHKDMGFVRCEPDKKDRSQVFLISLWVDPKARGQGLGEELVQASVAWAREARYEQLLLDVAIENSAAVGLYKKLAFKSTGETGAMAYPRQYIVEQRMVLKL